MNYNGNMGLFLDFDAVAVVFHYLLFMFMKYSLIFL